MISIHEDDWEMRSLHPLRARDEVIEDLDEAIAAGERNRVADGVWSAIHLIKSPSFTYADAGLLLSDAAAALGPLMPRVTTFHAGPSWPVDGKLLDPFSSHEEDAWCYGFDEDCFIKLETKEALVERIWFEHRTRDPERAAALRRSIEAIESLVPSLLVDHWFHLEGACGDPSFLDDYFASQEAHMAAVDEKWGKLEGEHDGP